VNYLTTWSFRDWTNKMLRKLLELLHIDCCCDYKDACPYFDEESWYCTEAAGGSFCGKWRRLSQQVWGTEVE